MESPSFRYSSTSEIPGISFIKSSTSRLDITPLFGEVMNLIAAPRCHFGSRSTLRPKAKRTLCLTRSIPVESGTSFDVMKSPPSLAAVSITFGPSLVTFTSVWETPLRIPIADTVFWRQHARPCVAAASDRGRRPQDAAGRNALGSELGVGTAGAQRGAGASARQTRRARRGGRLHPGARPRLRGPDRRRCRPGTIPRRGVARACRRGRALPGCRAPRIRRYVP